MKRIIVCMLLIASLLLTACSGGLNSDDGGDTNAGIGDSSGNDTGNGGNNAGDDGNDDSGDGSSCASHSDSNDDGRCDGCNISVVIVLDFYALNDLHGKLDDTDDCYGVDELTTYLKNANKTDDHTILLSSGDMWQGSSESNLTKGLIITEWMNELGFVSMTLGNHEYDWGSEYIVENSEIAEFPILAINVYDTATGKLADYCQPSVMVERGGVKIGIIGAIGDVKSSISASYVEDVEFKTGSALVNLVKAESERLRAMGAEFIVYSVHEDKSGYSSVLSNGYVDLVFEGHSHSSYVYNDTYGVYHLQNGGYDDGISHVEIKLNWANDTHTVNVAEIVTKYDYAHLSDDPIVDELLEKYAELIERAQQKLGYNNGEKDSDFVTDLVAELYVQAGLERWGDTYDIVLGGGFLRLRDPYYLPSGLVIYSDLMSILPFDNDIVLCSIKGDKLLSKFINTTNSSYHVAYSDYGDSIKSSIDRNATYYVIVDSYTSDYASNGLTVVDKYTPGIYARDLLADYIMTGALGSALGDEDSDGGLAPSLKTIDMVLSAALGSTQSTSGTVVGVNAQSFLLKDETGIILVYNGSNWNPDVEVGDVVVIESGVTSTYGNTVQFGKGSVYHVVDDEAVEHPEPQVLSASELDAYASMSSVTPLYVKITGKLSVSGSYYNVSISGASIIGSITYPINSSEIKALNGKNIVIEGYITSVSSGKYLNLLAIDVKEA